MKWLKAAWKSASAWAWLVLAVLAAIVGAVLSGFFRSKKSSEPGIPAPPSKLQQKVDKAEEEALKAKVEAKVQADSDKGELEEIAKIEDGRARRERLAKMLKRL